MSGAEVEVEVLGPVVVRRHGEPVEVPARQQRLVIALLVAHGEHGLATDRLIEEVWEDAPPSGARATLQSYVSSLRRVLGSDAIETVAGGYALSPAVATDLASLQSADPHSGLDLVRGEFAADLRPHRALDALAVDIDGQVQSRHLALLEADVGRDPASVVAGLRALVDHAPFDERPVELLMRALAGSGRTVEAIRVYQDHRRLLVEGTGLEPSPGLTALEAELVAGTAESPTPPASASTAPPPAPPANVFVERRELAESLARAVDAHRWVSVVGPGGAGKTRLVLELATQLGDRDIGYVDVELSGSEELGARLAAAAGPTPSSARSIVIVDNAEIDAPAVRREIDSALGQSTDITVVSVSRIRLGGGQEHVVRVDGLEHRAEGDGAATALLRARLAALTTAAVDDEALWRVASALDGLPLAIELAAEAVAARGVSAVLDALDAGELVGDPVVEVDQRGRSVFAIVRWALDGLSDGASRLAGALSIAEGTFDLEIVREVAAVAQGCAPSDLDELVEFSLIRVRREHGEPRYQWPRLTQLVTRRELVGHVAEPEIRAALVAVYAARAEAVAGRVPHMSADEWREAVELDLEGYSAAFGWAREMGAWSLGARILAAFMWRHYELADLALVEEWTLAADLNEADPVERAQIANAAACISILRGDYTATSTPTSRAVTVARRSGRQDLIAEALSLRFASAAFGGDTAGAAAQFAETEAACRASGHLWGLVFVHTFLGTALRRAGELTDSAERLEEAVRIADHVGEGRLQAAATSSLGRTVWQLGDPERGEHLCEQAWRIACELDDAASIALAGVAHGWMTHRRGDPSKATEILLVALDAARAMGNRTTISSVLEWLALISAEGGNPTVLASVDGFTERLRVSATSDRPQHEAAVGLAREELGEVLFDAARQRGHNSSLDEIIALFT